MSLSSIQQGSARRVGRVERDPPQIVVGPVGLAPLDPPYGSVLSACLAVIALTAPLRAADWPQLLGPTRNAVSTETGLAKSWPEKGPPVIWERDVGEGYSAPVVSGDTLILFHRVGDEEVVEALDAASGKPRWKFGYATKYADPYGKGDGPRSTPLVAGGKVYTLGAEGMLHCIDLKEGKKLWEKSLAKDYEPKPSFFGVGTSPLVEGDLLLVNVGAKGAGIVAFDRATGKEVWKATDDEASYSSPVAATIDGARHVIFFTRTGFVDLDPKEGKVRSSKRWRSRTEASVNAAAPLVIGDRVFLTSSYDTGALLLRVAKDGVEEVWSGKKSLSSHFNTPVEKDGYLYGIDGRQEQGARLRCVELKTGEVKWEKDRFGCASMILADGHVIALTEDGDLVLIDPTPEGYREKSRAAVLKATPCRAEIALADGRLYGRDGKKLVCWNLKK
jgi:outer membrane protein assembly factor BamB